MKSNHIESISREAALPALAIIASDPLFEKEWSPFWLQIGELFFVGEGFGLDDVKDSLID